MRRSRRKENARVKQRRLYAAAINNIVRSEPVIRVTDRRNNYETRKIQSEKRRKINLRKEFDRINAPNRYFRKRRNELLYDVVGGEVYHKIHNCKREWRKLLAWRSGQGGGRKRTDRELQNNKQSFIRKDC